MFLLALECDFRVRAGGIIGSGRECLDVKSMSPFSFTVPGTPVRYSFYRGALGNSESARIADEGSRAV